MADLSKIADELSNLTVLEAAELSKLLEEKWGVSAAAPGRGWRRLAAAMPAQRPLKRRIRSMSFSPKRARRKST